MVPRGTPHRSRKRVRPGSDRLGDDESEVRYQPGRSLKHPGPLLAPTSNDEARAAMCGSLASQIAIIREAWNVISELVAASSASKR
ncbi:MAG: hypothetical protein LZF62_340160 [Nitrospira sp.]|nr:MAG: hypothetical protein LZF62_340160 [Nitrospira sp.]